MAHQNIIDGFALRQLSLALRQHEPPAGILYLLTPWLTPIETQEQLVRHIEENLNLSASYKESIWRSIIRYIDAFSPTGDDTEATPETCELLVELYAECMCANMMKMAQGSGSGGRQMADSEADAGTLVQYTSTPTSSFESDLPPIQINEQRNVFAQGGCTGHRTWEAGIALADFIIESVRASTTPSNVSSEGSSGSVLHKGEFRHILELGAGTGLVGLVATVNLQPKKITLTDGDAGVITALDDTIHLNEPLLRGFPCDGPLSNEYTARTEIVTRTLWWNQDKIKEDDPAGLPDLILASDVTYDPTIIEPFIKCIDYIDNLVRTRNGGLAPRILVSATERSASTLSLFKTLCEENAFSYDIIRTYQAPIVSDLFYFNPSMSPKILIFELTKLA